MGKGKKAFKIGASTSRYWYWWPRAWSLVGRRALYRLSLLPWSDGEP